MALLLSFLLWNFSRIYQQSYLRSWFTALFAFAMYQLMILLQWLMAPPEPLMVLMQFITVAGSYGFAIFLLRGMRQTREPAAGSWLSELSSKALWLIICLVTALSVLPFVWFNGADSWQEYYQVYLRLLLMSILLLSAALSLLQRIENSLGQRLAVLAEIA